VKLYLPDGTTTDVIGITLPVFFTRTPEDLIEFNIARRPEPETGALDLAKVGAFLEQHPETVAAVTAADANRNFSELLRDIRAGIVTDVEVEVSRFPGEIGHILQMRKGRGGLVSGLVGKGRDAISVARRSP